MSPPTAAALLGPSKLAPSVAVNNVMPAGKSDAEPKKALSIHGSCGFETTGDPCLDFFFQVVPGTPADVVGDLLAKAWVKDPVTALKLVCNLRAIRGTGKADREGFYAAALWLHRYHPTTLALNTRRFAEAGCLKDLPEILYRLANGANGSDKARAEASSAVAHRERKVSVSCVSLSDEKRKKVAMKKKKKKMEMAGKAVGLYSADRDFRFLHDRVADLFAELLRADLERLRAGDVEKVGLAAKWCPSLDSSYDRSTLLCESIARRLFPLHSDPEYPTLEERHYAYRVRERLRKEVLVPLRRALALPEVLMASNQWELLSYERVASGAMRTHKDLFMRHDGKRLADYQEQVAEGKTTMAAGALLPHEILASACGGEAEDKVAELQWRRMVEDLSKKGKLTNCMAVCAMSGNMEKTLQAACVALGLLVAELSEEPWNRSLITFSRDPQLHRIEGKTLRERANFAVGLEHCDPDLQKVFDMILRTAAEGKLAAENMVKRVFVFGDMEFAKCTGGGRWETDYEAICRKFEEAGYGAAVPEVVFWNLTHEGPSPVLARQRGVALVSGFSKNLVKLFLRECELSNPQDVMRAALDGEEYENLVVFD
ncbi:hypothetical protein Taro_013128 [Colocasia esculenta]|uniref:Uncharacterized protein n=1 Tax=Colocasia esculenta TaxID=4460 RepID=A0A843UFI9_COLES|nr:hypothetical protein [Colocasia esculenta]